MPPEADICLINPPTTTSEKQIYFPMALVALASYLQEKGLRAEIIDFDLQLKERPLLRKWYYFKAYAMKQIAESRAPVIGISSICSNFPASLILARLIRKNWPGRRILLGGPQPSAVPEETLRACPWVDVVAVGEGEETLHELLKKGLEPDSLEDVPGIAFRYGQRIISTPKRSLMLDLDKLPFPNFEAIPVQKYRQYSPEISMIEAGRGCPFLCSFCSTAIMWQRKFRAKSPARILQEMRSLRSRYGMRNFALTHDNFTTSHSYVDSFCGYFGANNSEGFTWGASARSDTLNHERLHSLQAAGCRGLFFGVDSGSRQVQRAIQKNLNLDQFKQHLRLASSLGMPSTTSLIIGFPEESTRDLEETIRLGLWARRNGSSDVQIHRISPLAGTKLYNENFDDLTFDSDKDSDINWHPHQSREIDKLIGGNKKLFSSFYTIPTPQHGSLNLSHVAVFFTESITTHGSKVQAILDRTGWGPLELFHAWNDWRLRYQRRRSVDAVFVLKTFETFAAATLRDETSPEPSSIPALVKKSIASVAKRALGLFGSNDRLPSTKS